MLMQKVWQVILKSNFHILQDRENQLRENRDQIIKDQRKENLEALREKEKEILEKVSLTNSVLYFSIPPDNPIHKFIEQNPSKGLEEIMKTTLKDIFAGFLAVEHVIVPLFVKNSGSLKIAGIIVGVEEEIMAEIAALHNTTNPAIPVAAQAPIPAA